MATESTSQEPELRLSLFNHAGTEGAARRMCGEGDVKVKPSGKRIAIVSGLSVMSREGDKV